MAIYGQVMHSWDNQIGGQMPQSLLHKKEPRGTFGSITDGCLLNIKSMFWASQKVH